MRSEEYWRWLIGRKYAHVIWVACQGDAVRGYAFVKDHRVLEIASDPAHPQALRALLGRVRAEALERAYPQVSVHAPVGHPVIEAVPERIGPAVRSGCRRWRRQSMYHIPDLGQFLKAALPEFARRAVASGCALPLEIGVTTDAGRWLIHIEAKSSRVEPDKLSRRHLTLPPSTLVRLLMGHTSIDDAPTKKVSLPRPPPPSTPPASSSPSSPSGAARSTPPRRDEARLFLTLCWLEDSFLQEASTNQSIPRWCCCGGASETRLFSGRIQAIASLPSDIRSPTFFFAGWFGTHGTDVVGQIRLSPCRVLDLRPRDLSGGWFAVAAPVAP